jgi:hypothetical protein
MKLVSANVAPSWMIFVTLMMEVRGSCETWVLRRAKRLNISGNGILHCQCLENSNLTKGCCEHCNEISGSIIYLKVLQ